MAYNRSRIRQILYLAKYAAASRLNKSARKPLVASFKMTHDCNLNCMHCPFIKKNNVKTRMDFDTALKVLAGKRKIFLYLHDYQWYHPAPGL